MDELIKILFESRDYAHYKHLTVRKLGQHMALNTYYDSILDLVDTLAESYQRHDKTISVPASLNIPSADPYQYFSTLSALVNGAAKKDELNEGLRNILAEVVTLIDQTLYRLSLEKAYL